MIVVYRMRSTDPAPAGIGNTKDWFYRYKWKGPEGEEKFVPLKRPPAGSPGSWLNPSPGDTLVFRLDGRELGRVTVLRVLQETYGTREIWYDASTIQETPQTLFHRFTSRLRRFLGGSKA